MAATTYVLDWNAISAIAATAAALIALAIATHQERTRRDAEQQRARVVASSLAPSLNHLADQLSGFRAMLVFTNAENRHSSPTEATRALRALSTPNPTIEVLTALCSLPGNSANKLAYALSLLDVLRGSVDDFVDRSQHSNDPLPQLVADIWRSQVSEICDRLQVLARQFATIAGEVAPGPTGEELYGNHPDDE